MTVKVDIYLVTESELPEILALQKLAYFDEALRLNNFSIPPLMQTLDGVQDGFHKGFILKVVDTSIAVTLLRQSEAISMEKPCLLAN